MKNITRRVFTILCVKTGIGLASLLQGCSRFVTNQVDYETPVTCRNNNLVDEYEYIIVGSGAGGGPLAANLARQGYKVLLMEAGGDTDNDNYKVPIFHPQATEDPDMRWDFFVRHYEDDGKSLKDDKFCPRHNGVLYPRAGTLGGCTAHNAMIFVYPHNSDWDTVAKLTGDSTWSSDNMRKYFQRLENCQYVERPDKPDDNPSRHGFNGWLTTNIAGIKAIKSVLKDRQLRRVIFKSVIEAWNQKAGSLADVLTRRVDPNDWRQVKKRIEGLCLMPITTRNGKRIGSREYIKAVEQVCGENLTVKLHALVTRVILDENNTATKVEYLDGKRLYRADRNLHQQATEAPRRQIKASREIILCGGAFNTPQLLMLSGIGPAEHLNTLGINVKIDRPGVGENLQDRYEVGIVSEMKKDFSMLTAATFTSPKPGEKADPFYRDWQQGKGIYTTNGPVVSFIKKSLSEHTDPDLFIFGMPGNFRGYYPGYSKDATRDKRHFTWAILKAHTNNTAGTVRLKSKDPLDVPEVNFRYFDEGNDSSGKDLESVIQGVRFVRKLNQRAKRYISKEIVPGEPIQTQAGLEDFVKYNAWGHHASCTCKIGSKSDPMAVVDARFRVYGVENLRVVDASVFPKIPGLFIVSAIYMISEKAFDVIHEDAEKQADH